MAHYSIRFLSSTGPLQDMESSARTRTGARFQARCVVHKLFLGKHRHEWAAMIDWLDEIKPHPPKTYATVVTFEKILPGLGRFFIYCYKGDGR